MAQARRTTKRVAKRGKKNRNSDTLVVKRYPNRKLYDTERSTYVTLDDLAHMIRDGREIRVIDNDSQNDITSNTLTQIIFEMEKRNKSVLPIQTLQQIIRNSGSMTQFIQKHLKSGVSSLHQAKHEVEKSVKDLLDSPYLHLDELSHRLDEKVKATIGSVSGATNYKRKFSQLHSTIVELESKLDEAIKSAQRSPCIG